jgi:hypothetical protein
MILRDAVADGDYATRARVKIVYRAGPYSGNSMTEVARNIDEARKVALMLAERRIPFLCTILQKNRAL